MVVYVEWIQHNSLMGYRKSDKNQNNNNENENGKMHSQSEVSLFRNEK